jgi:hypothetical protein
MEEFLRPAGDVIVEIMHSNPFDPDTTTVQGFYSIVIEPSGDESHLQTYRVLYTADPEGEREELEEFKGEGDGGAPNYYEEYENAKIGSVRFQP